MNHISGKIWTLNNSSPHRKICDLTDSTPLDSTVINDSPKLSGMRILFHGLGQSKTNIFSSVQKLYLPFKNMHEKGDIVQWCRHTLQKGKVGSRHPSLTEQSLEVG